MAFFGIIKQPGLHFQPTTGAAQRREDRGAPGTVYPSIDAFYEAGGARRAFSIEHDFGLMWREGTRRGSRYRVSWIEATGELYALALSEDEHERKVELLAILETLDEVEALLCGWEGISYDELTLHWVRERVAHA